MRSPFDPGRRRLYPSLTDPNYLVLRSRRKIFASWFDELPKEKLRVLDVGSRHQPYRHLLGDRVHHYVSLDIQKTESTNVVADGQLLPFPQNSFDVVIATQVFEFFQNPGLAAEQMHAVLRPGGILFASLAAFAPLFVSGERWRFLPEGIHSIMHPFTQVVVVPEVHDVASLVRSVNVGLGIFFRFRVARDVYARTLCPMLNLVGAALEKVDVRSTDALTCNYSVKAVK